MPAWRGASSAESSFNSAAFIYPERNAAEFLNSETLHSPLGIEDGSAAIDVGGKEVNMIPPGIMPLPEGASLN
ncbi:MAG: hypothetical protein ACRD2B_18610 [Terriglobia bacterium]